MSRVGLTDVAEPVDGEGRPEFVDVNVVDDNLVVIRCDRRTANYLALRLRDPGQVSLVRLRDLLDARLSAVPKASRGVGGRA